MRFLPFLFRLFFCLSVCPTAPAEIVAGYGFENVSNLGENTGAADIGWQSFSGVTRSTTAKFGSGSGSFVRGTSQAVTGSLETTGVKTNRFTLSLHVRANMADTLLNNWPDFVSIGIPAGYARFVIEATGTGGGIALYKFSAAGTTDAHAAGTITSNAWNHLGIVSDGSTVTLYINGIASGNPIPYTAEETIAAVTLASRYGSTTRGINTLLDDVAVFGEALNAEQMAWLAGNKSGFSGYQNWSAQIPYAARRGAWVDHDGDGKTNLSEYLFGRSPLSPDGELISLSKNDSGMLVIRWHQMESEGEYQLERNDNLTDEWVPATGIIPVVDTSGTAPAGYVAMKAETPVSPQRGFFRMKATVPPGTPGGPVKSEIPDLPATAQLVLAEDWSGGINDARWYIPRKKWGNGNNGVTPANVRVETDNVWGVNRPVLVCQANGDNYDGPVTGQGGAKNRVGGMVVTRGFYASGRYEVVMKIGGTEALEGGPSDPARPIGTIPAVWVYGYRYVAVPNGLDPDSFHPQQPLYNPLMKVYGNANEYWAEIDFPEFGKAGNFDKGLYNTYLQTRSQIKENNDVRAMIDGQYHTLTTDWRTELSPLAGVTDAQVIEHQGFYWVKDKAVAFNSYVGNPLKKLGTNSYAVYKGSRADHYIDGKKVAENLTWVPSMASQLTMGIWLPDWAGAAPWKQSRASFASVKIWQFHDEGDVRGIIKDNITNTF